MVTTSRPGDQSTPSTMHTTRAAGSQREQHQARHCRCATRTSDWNSCAGHRRAVVRVPRGLAPSQSHAAARVVPRLSPRHRHEGPRRRGRPRDEAGASKAISTRRPPCGDRSWLAWSRQTSTPLPPPLRREAGHRARRAPEASVVRGGDAAVSSHRRPQNPAPRGAARAQSAAAFTPRTRPPTQTRAPPPARPIAAKADQHAQGPPALMVSRVPGGGRPGTACAGLGDHRLGPPTTNGADQAATAATADGIRVRTSHAPGRRAWDQLPPGSAGLYASTQRPVPPVPLDRPAILTVASAKSMPIDTPRPGQASTSPPDTAASQGDQEGVVGGGIAARARSGATARDQTGTGGQTTLNRGPHPPA